MRAPAALALLLAPALAGAQDFSAITGATPQQMDAFRTCRAAVFYHLDPGSAQGGVIPRAFAESLLDQITFVMAETVRNAPHASVAENRAAIEFTERFFLGFSRTIGEQTSLRTDVQAREKLLIACQATIWDVLRTRIDGLLERREQFGAAR